MVDLQNAMFRGDREEALALCRVRTDVASALIAARVDMAAGFAHEARDWVEIALARAVTPDEHRDVALNDAMLCVLAELNFSKIGLIEGMDVPSSPLARLWRTKLHLAAATYRELPPKGVAQITRGLRTLQRDLSLAGEVYDAHGVAMDRADRLSAKWRYIGWQAVEALGRRDKQPATCAKAFMRLAAIDGEAGNNPSHILDKAEQAFREADHMTGLVHVAAARVMWSVERQGAPTEELLTAADKLWEAGARKDALSFMLNAGQIADRRTERTASINIHSHLSEQAEKTGFIALARQGLLNRADRAMRDGLHAVARDCCDALLADNLPRVLRAMTLVVRGSAHSFMKARTQANIDRRAAYDIYMELGAGDLASDMICALAQDIASTRLEMDVAKADALLEDWVVRDTRSGNDLGAYQKKMQQAQNAVLVYLADGGEIHIAQAEAAIAAAEHLLGPNPDRHPDRAKMIAARAQTEAQIATAQNSFDGMLSTNQRARKAYAELEKPFEVANSDFLLGCLWLNQTNTTALQHKLEAAVNARNAFDAALAYYERIAGMRQRAAETRRMIAKLSINILHMLTPEDAETFGEEAAELLKIAAKEIDDLRRAITAPGKLDSYAAKSSLSKISQDIVEDALRLHLRHRPNPSACWLWAVRSKARGFVEMLGSQAVVPSVVRAAAEASSDIAALIAREADLSHQVAEAQPADRLDAVAALDHVMVEMAAMPELADYANRRSGGEVSMDALDIVAAETGRKFALVDWIQVGDSLHIIVARPGETPSIERLPVSITELQRELGALFRDERRSRMTLRGGPEVLMTYANIVHPLLWLANDGETLLFCSTQAINALPLHALPLGDSSVWHRHPIAYSLGLSVLRLVCGTELRKGKGLAVFGDPTLDRERAAETAIRIASSIGRDATLGKNADLGAITHALQSARVVHYQGHADFYDEDPMASHLRLSDGRLTARTIFDMPSVTASTVTLGACKGAQLGARVGDEPGGLIAALLVSGVRSVTAATWPVAESSAGLMMERYYADLLGGAAPIDALRSAALTTAMEPTTEDLYHWAPFRLYGNPWLAPFEGKT